MILSTHLSCLLNLSTTPQLCPPLLLAYTFDVLYLIRQHNQPKYYSLFTMRDLLCTIHYALCIIHYVLFTMYYALCIIHYAQCIIHYTLCTMNYSLYTMHYALCIIHDSLYTMHSYLYIFIRIYCFICIHTYLLFHMEIQRNPVILVLTRSSRRVE